MPVVLMCALTFMSPIEVGVFLPLLKHLTLICCQWVVLEYCLHALYFFEV